MSYDNEIWKDIKGYEGLYQVSNLGRVKNKRRNRLLKLRLERNGYLRVSLYKNSKVSCKFVHRLVAQNFIPNPNNLEYVNHKDEDKSNNDASNLEWCTRRYNNSYGTRGKRISKTLLEKYKNNPLSHRHTPVRDLVTGEVFNSVKEAAQRYGISTTHVQYVSQGKRKSKKYKFEYI